MKIICIGRNYADHAKEMNSPTPTEPVFFMKPDTALLPKRNPVYIPEFTNDLHFECEIVVRINRLGKNISEKFAHRYYDEIGVGIDFTARDIQQKCKEKGLPWEKAKAFDHSAPVGEKFIPISQIEDLNNLEFHLEKNGEIVQKGNTKDMIFTIDQLVAYVSKYVTLKIGDLIFTGTPAGVGPVKIGDQLTAFVNNEQLLKIDIK
ncbi:MAG: fumarylacetoacetate hydrolase family protein [Crocinitomicaceae bacterium]|nr:fumarylacetoacetate hydrolase family protein [Crocinitomicaceae bacterium]